MRHNISPRFTKVGIETKTDTDKTIISLETGHIVEIEINHIEAEEITIETINQIVGVDHETAIDLTIGETAIDKMIGKITTDKMIDKTIIGKIIEEIITETIIGQTMEETITEYRDREVEVKVGRILEYIREIIQEKDSSEVEIEADIGVEKDKHNQDQEHHQKTEMIGQDRVTFGNIYQNITIQCAHM